MAETMKISLEAETDVFNRQVDSAVARANAALKKIGGSNSGFVGGFEGQLNKQIAAMDKAVEGIGKSDAAAKAAAGKFSQYSTDAANATKSTVNVFGQLQKGIGDTIGKFTGLIGTIGGVVAALYAFKAALDKGADYLVNGAQRGREVGADVGLLMDNRGDGVRMAAAARSMGLIGSDGSISTSAREKIVQGLLIRGTSASALGSETDKIMADLTAAAAEYAAKAATRAYQNRLAEHEAFIADARNRWRGTAETPEEAQRRRFLEGGERMRDAAAASGPSVFRSRYDTTTLGSISGALGTAGAYGRAVLGGWGWAGTSGTPGTPYDFGGVGDRIGAIRFQRPVSAAEQANRARAAEFDALKKSLDPAKLAVDELSAAFDGLTSATTSAFDAWITGSQSGTAAFKGMLAETFRGEAVDCLGKAVKEGASALASLAVGNAPGAAVHGKAAAAYGVAAAVFGGAAKGMHSAGWAGGGATSGPSATSYGGGSRTGAGGGDTTVVVNVHDSIVDSDRLAGKVQEAVLRGQSSGAVRKQSSVRSD